MEASLKKVKVHKLPLEMAQTSIRCGMKVNAMQTDNLALTQSIHEMIGTCGWYYLMGLLNLDELA